MSIRLKVFMIISVIVLLITASGVIISILSAQSQIIGSLERDMRLVTTLANEYISGEIDLLKANAASVAQRLKTTRVEELQQILIEQVAAYEQFNTITVINASGRVEASYGPAPAPVEIILHRYGDQDFMWSRTISTSRIDSSGNLVFHVFVPMDDSYYMQSIIGESDPNWKIVACSIPGDYFSKRMSRFLLWETGNIIMEDGEGTLIASVTHDWVVERVNFMEIAKDEPHHYTDAAKITERMIAGETDTVYISLEGTDAAISFAPITASEHGWSIGVIAPTSESPFYKARDFIIVTGCIFLSMGILAATVAAGFIARPFYRIEEQNVRLTELGEAVKAASKAKSTFLANISHDMRTPLNMVIGLSELAIKQKPSAEIGGNLKKIQESGKTLLGVVDDLLEISNLDTGKFRLVNAEYNVATFINSTANANKLLIGGKPVTFNLVLGDNLPARLIGDELRVREVFNNLLENAFAFTENGTVEWNLSAEKDGDSVYLVSSISDTGIGIKPEDLEKLFTDYRELDARKLRNLEGTGLGLALTRRIVELMEGTISAESAFGKGSVFKVRIKQKSVNEKIINPQTLESLKKFILNEAAQSENTETERLQLTGKRVLVVDDIELNLDVAESLLEPYGMKIDGVSSGAEALELVRKGEPKYDMIFMDHMMPEMDGMETVAKIRSSIETDYAKTVPIIAVTATGYSASDEVFLGNGFQDRIAKPLGEARVDEVVRRWLAG